MAKIKHIEHVDEVVKALGIDPEKVECRITPNNELIIEGVDDADIEAAEATLDIPALDKRMRNAMAKANRQQEYPSVGDQLDAIWKQLKKMQIDNMELDQESSDMLDSIEDIKKKYPKED